MSDTDLELLARYTRHQAQDAFAELVRRQLREQIAAEMNAMNATAADLFSVSGS